MTSIWLLLASVLVRPERLRQSAGPLEPALLSTATIQGHHGLDGPIRAPSSSSSLSRTIGDEQGIREIAPQTDEEWQNVGNGRSS